MSGRFKASNHQIKDLNGRLLGTLTTEEQNKRWVEHFKQLLNRPPPANPPTLPPSDQEGSFIQLVQLTPSFYTRNELQQF